MHENDADRNRLPSIKVAKDYSNLHRMLGVVLNTAFIDDGIYDLGLI